MRIIVRNGLLIAMALALSYFERILPVGAIVPLPGVKLGLANIVTMFALFYIGFQAALTITVIRCVMALMFYGSITSLALSLSGGILALLIMDVLKTGYGKYFSLIGISIAGAAFHNFGQVLMAALLMNTTAVFAYLTVLFFIAIATGLLTGTVAGLLFEKLDYAIPHMKGEVKI